MFLSLWLCYLMVRLQLGSGERFQVAFSPHTGQFYIQPILKNAFVNHSHWAQDQINGHNFCQKKNAFIYINGNFLKNFRVNCDLLFDPAPCVGEITGPKPSPSHPIMHNRLRDLCIMHYALCANLSVHRLRFAKKLCIMTVMH